MNKLLLKLGFSASQRKQLSTTSVAPVLYVQTVSVLS